MFESAAAAHAALTQARTPSGEFRISQIRDLLFGDVQQRYEQRLADLEAQFVALQAESRARIEIVETSFVGEVGDAMNALTDKVVTQEAAGIEDRARVEARVSELEGAVVGRLDAFATELAALRSDLDALTEGLRVEAAAMGNRLAAEMRRELSTSVQLRVREEISRLFLALGQGLRRSIDRAEAREDVEPTNEDEVLASEPTAPIPVPSSISQTEAPAPSSSIAELEKWAENLSSGDIRILDPETESEDPTEAVSSISRLPSAETI